MEAADQTSYDSVPYPSSPMAQTHPDRLATTATLFGMSPAPVERCRVLELGCATGGNLIAMAEQLPFSQFVGIDLSRRQIAEGQALVHELGIENIVLRPMSILDVTPELGQFDYIICHGVYSWVPRDVQAKILAVCKQNLAPNGVAFISYNVYPGWHSRGMVRDMMQFHARHGGDPETCTKRARELLAWLIASHPDHQSSYSKLLREEQQRIEDCRDSYVFHEHLEEVNDPVYFHEFTDRASRLGLQYLGDAEIITSLVEHYPPQVAATLGKLGSDFIGREQYLDFLKNRMFRQSLLCHSDVSVCRELKPERVFSLYAASCARCESSVVDIHSTKVEEFRAPNGVSAGTSHSISKSAMVYLAEIWPQSISVDDLQAVARAKLVSNAVVVQEAADYARDTRLLAENLLHAFTVDVVELHAFAPRFVVEPAERPSASRLARYQAERGNRITSARHKYVELDPLSCVLLRHLDGTRNRTELVELLTRAVTENGTPLERFGKQLTETAEVWPVLTQELDENLRRLARVALLVA
jgi:methyltransferase-like protein/cyclopropane fatty-acyl-phospholipid synthase-like methyltransferase